MNHRMREMTGRRLDKALLRCKPLTNEQAFALLCSGCPPKDMSESERYGAQRQCEAIETRRAARRG